jgi:predicted metal-dependent hydrolase
MSYTIHIGKTAVPYHIRENSRSKRLRLIVTPRHVEVVVPNNTPESRIEQFVHEKRCWILNKLDSLNEREKRALQDKPDMPDLFRSGAKIPYRGRMMPLSVSRNGGSHIQISYRHGFSICVPEAMPSDVADFAIRRELRAWLRLRLAQDCAVLVRRYSKELHVKPKRISIKTRQHFWGYCSKDGVVGVNWRLIFAPKAILEYVVAHEICHLKYRNHTEDFWNLLGSVLPDWPQLKAWLEKNERLWDISF